MTLPARAIFDQNKIHPAIADKVGSYQADVVARVRGLVEQHDVVVVGMSMNPFPGRARRLLEERGIPFEYLELGSYLSQWRVRLALKMWTGWPTFPMIFVKGAFIGGFDDLKRLVDAGELGRMLA